MFHRYVLAAAAALTLCAAAVPASASNGVSLDLSGITSATQADLAAAKADADAHGDTFASECYAGVEALLAQANPNGALTITAPVGLASAFQMARDGVKGLNGAASAAALPAPVVQACGPLALDVQGDLGRVAAGGINLFGFKLF